MSTPDLTPVELAVAEAICDAPWPMIEATALPEQRRLAEKRARTVVAAVRPLIEVELREQIAAEHAKVAEFVAARAEFITAINNCHPDNAADYHRWQGHAEARRVLAEALGLPVAWPALYAGPRGGASDGQ